jgi:dihydroorotate dehydrogenase electron transfer subunit
MIKSASVSPPHTESNPLHAAYYADTAIQRRVTVAENVRLARDTYRVRFECPDIARRIVPGQFVMMRLTGPDDPLLARPLALYDTLLDAAGRPTAVDIVYLVVGKMTGQLAECRAGDELGVWGPLGNGFPPRPTGHLIMVAGGIGQTPFLALGREYLGRRRYGDPLRTVPPARRVTLCYGVRTGALAAGVDDFQAAGFDVRLSSDDGTLGHHGLVTDVLRRVLDETAATDRLIVCCGPEPMMQAVAELSQAAAVPCLVSLETPMACGIGICFSCVVKVRQPDGGWDYKRTCVEGPVFDAGKIEW